MWHPFLISIFVADLVGVLFFASSVKTAVRVLLGWSQGSSDRHQLSLEVGVEIASIRTYIGASLFLLATAAWVVAITLILPKYVPGAMCGTGVLQATQGVGMQALVLRGIGLVLLFVWHLLDRLNRYHPEAPLTQVASRALLLALPIVALAVFSSVRAVFRLSSHQPVECCAAVVRRAGDLIPSVVFGNPPSSLWTITWGIGGGLLCLLAAVILRHRLSVSFRFSTIIGVVAWCWMVLAVGTLVHVLAPYHYGVLQHHCPWCLMLPEHGMLGFVQYGALAVVVLEATGLSVCSRVAVSFPHLAESTRTRLRRAAARILVACPIFFLSAGLPALVWRLRYGVWL